MAQVEISINDKAYRVTCEDGQEDRLQRIAAYLNRHIRNLSDELGQIGDPRLMLLSALTVCDELFDAREQILALTEENDDLSEETLGGAARAVDAATNRIKEISERLAS